MGFKCSIEIYGRECFIEIEKRARIIGYVFVITLFDEELIHSISSTTVDIYQEENGGLRLDFLQPPSMQYIDIAMSVMDQVQYVIDEGLL